MADQNQLDIQNQINSALTARSALFKKQAGMLEGQVQLARELCSALKCENLEGMDDRLGEIRSSMETAANEAERTSSGMQDTTVSAEEAGKSIEGASRQTGIWAKLTGALSVGWITAKASMMAFGKGLKYVANIISAAYGLWDRFTGFIISASNEAAQATRVVAQAHEDLRGTFGDLSTGVGKVAVESITKFDASMAKAGVNAGRFFGAFGEGAAAKIKAIGEAVAGFGALAAGPLSSQIAGAAGHFVLLQKGAGLSNEAFAALGNRALNAGQTLEGVMDQTSRSIASVAKAIGVSTKTLGMNFDVIAKDVSNFGHLSIDAMTSLAAVMTKTGISMSTVQGIAKQFDNFEQGAESVAKLTQAFGMNLNAADMLNASDEERMSMMRESFLSTGKSIDQLSRQERQYLASSAGIAEGDLERVFGDQAGAIDETATAAEKAQQAQLDSAESLKEIAKSVQSIFKPVQSLMSLFGAFFNGFKKGFGLGSKGLGKVYKMLSKIQDIGVRVGKVMADFFDRIGFFETVFDLDGTIKHFEKFADIIDVLFGKNAEGSAMERIKKAFGMLQEYIVPKVKAAFTAAWGAFTGALNWLRTDGYKLLKDNFFKVFDWLTSPEMKKHLKEKLWGMIDSVKDYFSGAAAKIPGSKDVMGSIKKAFKDVWEYLKSPEVKAAIKGAIDSVWQFVKDKFKEHIMPVINTIGTWIKDQWKKQKPKIMDGLSKAWEGLKSFAKDTLLPMFLKAMWDVSKWLIKNAPKIFLYGALGLMAAIAALFVAGGVIALMIGEAFWKLGTFVLGGLKDMALDAMSWVADTASEVVTAGVTAIKDGVTNMYTGLKDKMTSVATSLDETTGGIFSSFGSSLEAMNERVSSATSSIKESFMSAFGSVRDSVTSSTDVMTGAFNDFVGWVGGLLPDTVKNAVAKITKSGTVSRECFLGVATVPVHPWQKQPTMRWEILMLLLVLVPLRLRPPLRQTLKQHRKR